ncbi:MAG: isochorismatase family protein [Verrucomicrobia bacterium]|nr:isochorismatase family protein [Verrucomicrobiota bacterium]
MRTSIPSHVKELERERLSNCPDPALLKVGTKAALQRDDVLVVVDVQNDFLPGGALAVPHGDEVVPILNRYIERFVGQKLPIFATRDWHPANHCSFQTQGGPWPKHCVMYSYGAESPPQLKLPATTIIVSKPCVADRETYSAFEGTNFEEQLRSLGVHRLFIGGLATDYCVLITVLGARQRGFDVLLLRDAVRAVNVHPDDGKNAEQEMFARGAVPLELKQLAT